MADRLISDGRRIQRWMHARSFLPIMVPFHGIAREVNGAIVAAVGFDHFQDRCCCFHICLATPTALNRQLLWQAFRVPFGQWGYDELLGMVRTDNMASRNLAARLGFQEFAVRAGMRFFAMKKEDCRWLKLPEKTAHVRRWRQRPNSSESLR